jgi:hypothetical protein
MCTVPTFYEKQRMYTIPEINEKQRIYIPKPNWKQRMCRVPKLKEELKSGMDYIFPAFPQLSINQQSGQMFRVSKRNFLQ